MNNYFNTKIIPSPIEIKLDFNSSLHRQIWKILYDKA